jgi:hypothetical protein
MSLKLIFCGMQVLQMHLRLNLEEVIAGHITLPHPQPGIRVAGDLESVFSLPLPGASTIHMNGSQPVLKTKGRHAMNIFDHYRQRYEAAKDEEFTLQEFLTICRQDRSAYANAAERLLMAIGEPVMVDTAGATAFPSLFEPGYRTLSGV